MCFIDFPIFSLLLELSDFFLEASGVKWAVCIGITTFGNILVTVKQLKNDFSPQE